MSLEDFIKQAEVHEQEQWARINVHLTDALHELESWHYAQLGSQGEPVEADEVETLRADFLRLCASAFTRAFPGQRKQ